MKSSNELSESIEVYEDIAKQKKIETLSKDEDYLKSMMSKEVTTNKQFDNDMIKKKILDRNDKRKKHKEFVYEVVDTNKTKGSNISDIKNKMVRLREVLASKEFIMNEPTPNTKDIKLDFDFSVDKLEFTKYQHFIKNFSLRFHDHNKILLKWDTGMGKTLGSLFIAFSWYYMYKNMDFKPNIFILGFSKRTYIDTLVNHTYFGFITPKEVSIMKEAKKNDSPFYYVLYDTIKKRITKNKHIHFMGYKSFANRLVLNSKERNLSNLELHVLFKENKLILNDALLKQLEYSIVICDEIHNTYNSLEQNNWGFCIQKALNYHKTTKKIYLSATPVMHSPTEILDLYSIMFDDTLSKNSFFRNLKLIDGASEMLRNLFFGHISFTKDAEKKTLPDMVMIGKEFKNNKFYKYVFCPMADKQKKEASKLKSQVSQSQSLNDSNSSDVINMIDIQNFTTTVWDFSSDITKDVITLKNLHSYSSKFDYMVRQIIQIMKSKQGKVFIYNNLVVKGVNVINDVFKKLGFVFWGQSFVEAFCVSCGKIHKQGDPHNIDTITYVVLSGETPKKDLNYYLSVYNAPQNTDGHDINILVGSYFISEGYTFMSTRHLFVVNRPNNIQTLNQIIGRVVRHNSHQLLDPKQRTVSVYNLCSSEDEIKIYNEKFEIYDEILKIDRILNQCAVDIYSNRNLVLPGVRDFKMLPYDVDSYVTKHIVMDTFNAFFVFDEVNMVIDMIKILFNYVSYAWEYNKLFEALRTYDFKKSYNANLITKEMFDVCLFLITTKEKKTNIFFDKNALNNIQNTMPFYLFEDKLFCIKEIGGFFVRFLLNHIDIDQCFRTKKMETKKIKFSYSKTETEIMNIIQTIVNENKIWGLYDLFTHLLVVRYAIVSYEKKKTKLLDSVIDLYKKNRIIVMSKDSKPIGYHFNRNYVMLWENKNWIKKTTASRKQKEVIESDVLVGYEQINPSNFTKRMNLKLNFETTKKFKDARKIKTGIACTSIGLDKLKKICNILHIPFNTTKRKRICSEIRTKLIEKNKQTKKKWFYTFNEPM